MTSARRGFAHDSRARAISPESNSPARCTGVEQQLGGLAVSGRRARRRDSRRPRAGAPPRPARRSAAGTSKRCGSRKRTRWAAKSSSTTYSARKSPAEQPELEALSAAGVGAPRVDVELDVAPERRRAPVAASRRGSPSRPSRARAGTQERGRRSGVDLERHAPWFPFGARSITIWRFDCTGSNGSVASTAFASGSALGAPSARAGPDGPVSKSKASGTASACVRATTPPGGAHPTIGARRHDSKIPRQRAMPACATPVASEQIRTPGDGSPRPRVCWRAARRSGWTRRTTRSSGSSTSAAATTWRWPTPDDAPLLYDPKDLTTHAVCVGMTGSGKTGLCLVAARRGRDRRHPGDRHRPQGRPGNLLLDVPGAAARRLPPLDRRRRGAHAAGMHADELRRRRRPQRWRERARPSGAQDGERIRAFRDAVDASIYTPGSRAGLPLTVLRVVRRAAAAMLRATPTRCASDAVRPSPACSALMGIDADPVRSREHILLSNLLGRGLARGTRPRPRRADPRDPVAAVRARSASSTSRRSIPPASAAQLAMRLNNLLASPSFAGWLRGRAARHRPRCCTRRRASRGCRSSRSPISTTRSGCSSSRCC